MKVGIDTFGCGHGRSGIGTYLVSLCAHLPDDGTFQFELFGSEMDRYTYNRDKNIGYAGISAPDNPAFERLWHLFQAQGFIKKKRYDCVLFPAGPQLLQRAYSFPAAAVVHEHLSLRLKTRSNWFSNTRVLAGLKRVARVIAPSQFVRKDLMGLGIDGAKIEVVHNGIDHALFCPRSGPEDAPIDTKPFAVKRPYFVYVTSLSGPEKKHVELIQAFNLFKLNTGLPHRLVLAGSDGPGLPAARAAAQKSPFTSDILLTGYFPHEGLPQLYAGADAFVFPASGEGSALPVIEAMAVGIPCVCSRGGVLPEIAGNHALFFTSGDAVDIALGLEKIVSDGELRKTLVSGGLEWTRRFTWEKTARRTLDVLQSIC
ncbi:MAG: glycosyltransferase family 4 protein [Spirochaetaceae bacterium]|jgi:glycosyltransferase involved in cell wall biosynthesis|nr:glycosyltransferase family 4 protein [Spirochaetaceae bacterium]